MKCTNCGYEYPGEVAFCSNCGSPMKQNLILKALKHPLFLTMSILISVGCGFGFLSEDISVIGILLTIFFWLAYAGGQKGVVSQKHLRSISGTLFASYVVNYVVFGAIAIVGIAASLFLFLFGNVGMLEYIVNEWEVTVTDHSVLMSEFAITFMAIVFAVFCLVVAAVGIVLNAVGYRKIHKFAQSVYLNVNSDSPVFYKPSAARAWLIVFGILYGISIFSGDLFSALADASYGAAFIVGSVWVGKNFTDKKR